MSRFQDVKAAYASGRKKYDGYYSECAYFAGAFFRALIDRFGWPRELVSWERAGVRVAKVEDALVLDQDTYWHLGLHLRLQDDAAAELSVPLRFKKLGERWVLEIFTAVEFEVREPTADAFQPALDALFDEIATFYERGLDLFLENRAGKLRIPFTPPQPRPLPEPKS
jgi:hypothetical protein